MSTPTTDLREIFARIEQGFAGCREAAVLQEVIQGLVWEPVLWLGETRETCRHCGMERSAGHAAYCIAKEVV